MKPDLDPYKLQLDDDTPTKEAKKHLSEASDKSLDELLISIHAETRRHHLNPHAKELRVLSDIAALNVVLTRMNERSSIRIEGFATALQRLTWTLIGIVALLVLLELRHVPWSTLLK